MAKRSVIRKMGLQDFASTTDDTDDSNPLPRIDDTIDTLANAKWFSTLDVEMDQRDKDKIAFFTSNGLWHFNVMPFGLCNAPATFETLMECILRINLEN